MIVEHERTIVSDEGRGVSPVARLARELADARERLEWYKLRVIDLENEIANLRARAPL